MIKKNSLLWIIFQIQNLNKFLLIFWNASNYKI